MPILRAGSSEASDFRFRDNFSFSNEHWKVLNLSLDGTPQISFTQYTNFNASSDISSTVSHITISSRGIN